MTEKDNVKNEGCFGYPLLYDVRRHGNGFCDKVEHTGSGGYMHREHDDTMYLVDGVPYCGRCHHYMGQTV